MDSFAYFEHVLAVFSIKMRPFCDYVNLQKQFVIFRACLPSVEADKRVKRDPGSACQNQDLRVRVQPADADGNRHPAADVEKFVKAAADTTMSWNDAEIILKALGFFLEFDWR